MRRKAALIESLYEALGKAPEPTRMLEIARNRVSEMEHLRQEIAHLRRRRADVLRLIGEIETGEQQAKHAV